MDFNLGSISVTNNLRINDEGIFVEDVSLDVKTTDELDSNFVRKYLGTVSETTIECCDADCGTVSETPGSVHSSQWQEKVGASDLRNQVWRVWSGKEMSAWKSKVRGDGRAVV